MFGNAIFWINCLAIFCILFSCTVIGRPISALAPMKLRPRVAYYLSPALGMALLILGATFLGHFFAFKKFSTEYFLFIFLVSLILSRMQKNIFYHASAIGFFGIFCSIPFLFQLLLYGGYNPHNDTFTYLAISDWLQHHAFNTPILPEAITPANTQVVMYQAEGFRMGGSYFLAFIQSISHVTWAYSIYPSAILSPVAVCCLSMGLLVFQKNSKLRRFFRLGILALPSLSLGGIVFGNLYGFMPQTFGLAMGGAALFLFGAFAPYTGRLKNIKLTDLYFALPFSLLYSACVVCYPELAIFISLSLIITTALFIYNDRALTGYLIFWMWVGVLTCVLANYELGRAVESLRIQSQAVVGTPINWPLMGFFFHMLGIHGGGWDIFQWSMTAPRIVKLLIAVLTIVALIFLLLKSRSSIFRNSALVPTIVILGIFIISLFYFRYIAENHFNIGMGQTWSQFKLADWAHPFVMALLLFSLIIVFNHNAFYLELGIVALLFVLVGMDSVLAVKRMHPVMDYYREVTNLDRFYQEARESILSECQNSAIYLNLTGSDLKFRQMLSLYLSDRHLKSDWTDDSYIVNTLPVAKRNEILRLGDCLIEIAYPKKISKNEKVIYFFKAVHVDGRQAIPLTVDKNEYNREYDRDGNWWYWVKSEINFMLHPLLVFPRAHETEINFDYMTRGEQELIVTFRLRNGKIFSFHLAGFNDAKDRHFSKIIPYSPGELSHFSIHTNGVASRLSAVDSREAAWRVQNVYVK